VTFVGCSDSSSVDDNGASVDDNGASVDDNGASVDDDSSSMPSTTVCPKIRYKKTQITNTYRIFFRKSIIIEGSLYILIIA
jgi:hypothetical protein